MRSQSIQVENEAMCGLKLSEGSAQQVYILHHDLNCHPGFLQPPEMHAIRGLAAKAVCSSLSELVLPHEHNLRQPSLDLRAVADCRNMGNGRPLRCKGSIATERHAGAQQAVRPSAYVALTFLRNQSDTGLIHIDQRPDLFRWIQMLQVIAPPPQGGGLKISGVAPEHKFRTPRSKKRVPIFRAQF